MSLVLVGSSAVAGGVHFWMSFVNSRERPQAALDGRGKEAPITEFLLSLELAQMFLGHTEIDPVPKPRPPAMVFRLLAKCTDTV